jgi:hypothetical protein
MAILESTENWLVPIQSVSTLDFISIDLLSVELVVIMVVSEDESLRFPSSGYSLNSGHFFTWPKIGEASALSDMATSAYKDPRPEAIFLFSIHVPRLLPASLGRLTLDILSRKIVDDDDVETDSGDPGDSVDSGDSRLGLSATSENGLNLGGVGLLRHRAMVGGVELSI